MLQALLVNTTRGNFEWVARAGSRLRDESQDPSVRALAARTTAYALAQTERSSAARLALLDVLQQLLTVNPFWGWSSLTTLAVLTYRLGWDVDEVASWLAVYERASQDAPGEYPAIVPAARAWVRAQIDPLSRPAELLTLVREAPVPDGYPLEVAATHEMLVGAAAWLLDEPLVARARLERSIGLMRRADAPGEMTQTLIGLALVQFATGDYDAVDDTGRLILDIAEARSQTYAIVDGLELRARVAGIRGDVATARELCERVLLELPAGEAVALEVTIRMTMANVRLAEQDVEGAWNQARWVFHEDGEPRHRHISYRELGHYVAVAARAGAAAEVERVLAVAEHRLATSGPFHRIQLARAQALVAGEDAEPLHRAAVTDPLAAQWPFDLANAQLEYGGWLRRRHRQTEARAQLQPALDTFQRLGTRPWVDLARAELRAAGVATADPEPAAWGALTGQERQVVRLAAVGLTNREIAASLFLSPRTVSTHLYNAFPKLGVTGRAQLRDVIADVT
jgi:DNA-binding CsgD family transcriptional regulator